MAELKPYRPTLRDRLATLLMGDSRPSPERRRMVEGLTGGNGLGMRGPGLADFVPGGQIMAVDEAMQDSDPQAMATAIMPGAAGAKRVAAAGEKALLRELLENAPHPGAKHGHLAERYPEVGPPELKVDKKRGKEFLGKKRTAEEEALMKDRLAIQKDMDENGYEPYFDPAQRADVDKSFYPTEQNTLRDVVAAKQATRDNHAAVASSPESIERLTQAFQRGQEMPGAENWYWMKQLEDEFVKELGPEAGRAAFKDRFAGGMAATTGGMDPMNNLLLSQYGAYQKTHGLPIPEAGHQIPSPMGGPYTYGNLQNYYKMQGPNGLDMDALQNPKRHNFQYNFLGHEDKATIDEQMSDLIKPGLGMPPAGNYGTYEQPAHTLAAQFGVSPRYFQEVSWAGGKQMKNEAKGKVVSHHEGGKPMIQFVNDAIERTHRLTGMPRKEILRRALIKGEIPLYGTAAAATVAGMHGLNDEPSEY